MSTAGETKSSRGPKGAAPCESESPTRRRGASAGARNEADR
jgi:hypothetical protein